MRPEMIESSSPYSMNLESPKASSIWSTERRLLERPPPCRPQKSGRRASLSSAYICDQESYETSSKKQRNERLLLPSRTINEDDESPNISLSFRRTNLTSIFNNSANEISSELLHTDPTTVLLIPETSPLPWYSNDDDEDDDDMILSPRLFRFGQQQHNLSCFASIDLADDDASTNNNIFREFNSDEDDDDDENNDDKAESREIFSNEEIIQRRFTWASPLSGFPLEATASDDDDRN